MSLLAFISTPGGKSRKARVAPGATHHKFCCRSIWPFIGYQSLTAVDPGAIYICKGAFIEGYLCKAAGGVGDMDRRAVACRNPSLPGVRPMVDVLCIAKRTKGTRLVNEAVCPKGRPTASCGAAQWSNSSSPIDAGILYNDSVTSKFWNGTARQKQQECIGERTDRSRSNEPNL